MRNTILSEQLKGVLVTNTKGGVGKTCLAHSAAWSLSAGLVTEPIPAYYFHTDDNKGITELHNRPYRYINCAYAGSVSYPEEGKRAMAFFEDRIDEVVNVAPNGLCLIDNGGNKPQFSMYCADIVDLVVVVLALDEEAIDRAIEVKNLIESINKNIIFVVNEMPSAAQLKNLPDEREALAYLESFNIPFYSVGRGDRLDRLKKRDNIVSGFVEPTGSARKVAKNFLEIILDNLE